MRDKGKEYVATTTCPEEMKKEIEKAFRAGVAEGISQATTIRPKEEIEIER